MLSMLEDSSSPYEAPPPAFSYDELFPSLPENEIKVNDLAGPNNNADMGQWTNKMKLKSTVITQMFRVPVEERRFREMNNQRFGEQGEQAKICADIMQKTGAHIEISSSKDQSLTILVTGKEEAVLKARRQIVKELQTQAFITISIPKEHHRFLLGKGGEKLTKLELSTATKISVPRPDKNSDLIEITGTKEGIDRARHEIQLISDEQGKLAFERLNIEKVYHPFIFGPHNSVLNQIVAETGARINIPPPSIMRDELTIAGEKEAVAQAKERVLAIYEERKRNCRTISVEITKNQHKYVIGQRGATLQEILAETGVSVEIPPADKQSDTITLRGDQDKLGPALTMVYSKANSVKTEHLDVPSWLHKYIIGKKGANIKNLLQELAKVQVDFIGESIKIEGPKEDVEEACKELKKMVENLRKQIAYDEVKVNPSLHRHIIGKNGANINRLKEDTKTLINIPSDGDSDIVRIEGPPEGVAQVKSLLLEMINKMENEVTKDLVIEQRFHRSLIGTKGEKIREIRDKFNQVNITFPEPGFKSDKVSIRGPKPDVDACIKYLKGVGSELVINNFTVEVPIYKQHHKFIIGKGGANIKKIRDETNTKIDLPAEGAVSENITIRGKKEDVLLAKNKILAIQEELANVISVEIRIPAKLHNSIIGTKGKLIRSITEDCGGVTIKFPTEGSGNDKVSIRGPKEDVEKAKKLLVELSNEKQLTGHTAEVKASPEQHKFLIGKNGANIKKVRDKTNARIVFPNETDDDRDTITIIGRKEEVEAAKKELESIIDDLKNTDETTVEIEPKHHKYFVARRAEELKKISDEFGGVAVSFPRIGSNSNVVTLKGAKDYLGPAKQRLLEIVKDLDAMVTKECIIPQEHHRTVLGSKGSKVQYIQRQFNVTIKFPDRERGEDNGRPTMNGDYHPEEAEVDTSRNIIIVKGKQEDCDAACQALLDLVPVSESVEVPYDLHRFIIGQKGRDVRSMMEKFDVSIIIPPQQDQSDVIIVKGTPDNVAKTKEALKERVGQLELDKQDRILKSFKVTFDVDPVHHPKIIGRAGANVNKIRKDFDVNINCPDRDLESESAVTIIGYEKNVLEAQEHILKLVQEQENMYKEEVTIDNRIHSRIIGSRGRNVRQIMDQYKVDIRFPRSGEDPDIVIISGNEDDVLDAKDHLLNLEEEYIQDVKERDFMKQYTHPPSRNGNYDANGPRYNDKGFVVKGAPWEKGSSVPDTTNVQEFPSFGSGGDMPTKPVAWGPSRR
ncbi:hypothetical protein JTE90_000083 [Oedothorax gibbosus]|uniref:K Homology domain-containing protein n=1 Tax=Oedothorax gibbosus TaxID=931172 RepID=A0AAV6UCK6_9ARAC|nr:hypothetical protein JTE90_000083 [Oedothorax gibbosus]